MRAIFHPDSLVALATLIAMEIVLGIDNVIFVAILVSRVEAARREALRRTGLVLALVMRVGLLFTLSFLLGLTRPVFTVLANEISGRDLILLLGGAFLIAKSTKEIHEKLEGPVSEHARPAVAASGVLLQIVLVDVVFSLDSVITAVGMADDLWVMVVAMIVASIVMVVFAQRIGEFVDRHPTVKILALAFLILIGVMLVAEGLGQHVSKGYVYFAMAFSLVVELVNMRIRAKHEVAATKAAHGDA